MHNHHLFLHTLIIYLYKLVLFFNIFLWCRILEVYWEERLPQDWEWFLQQRLYLLNRRSQFQMTLSSRYFFTYYDHHGSRHRYSYLIPFSCIWYDYWLHCIYVKGFGNLGTWAPKSIYEKGGKVVVVSDIVVLLETSIYFISFFKK